MKRRIETDIDGPSDVSDRPHFYLVEKTPWAVTPRVLRDEALWKRYEAACQQLAWAQAAIEAALVDEPFDEQELRLANQLYNLSHEKRGGESVDWEAYDRVVDELREHMRNA